MVATAREQLLPVPPPFHFRDLVFAHGWLHLEPYRWDEETETLARTEQLPTGEVIQLSLSAHPEGVWLRTDAPAEALRELVRRARWMLALDEEFAQFHALCGEHPGLATVAERGQGRILRCPTVWEDLVKTLFSVNTTWGQTVAMTRNLVQNYGPQDATGHRAFPAPAEVARVEPAELQSVCRVGYRAADRLQLARELAEARLDLETLKDRSLPTEEVEARLRSLRGIGPYAAANMLMLLGRYDHIPVDSWFRATVRRAWFEGREVPDRELLAAFERFRPYRTLAWRFHDWRGADGDWR